MDRTIASAQPEAPAHDDGIPDAASVKQFIDEELDDMASNPDKAARYHAMMQLMGQPGMLEEVRRAFPGAKQMYDKVVLVINLASAANERNRHA